jgi:hypothetical protein
MRKFVQRAVRVRTLAVLTAWVVVMGMVCGLIGFRVGASVGATQTIIADAVRETWGPLAPLMIQPVTLGLPIGYHLASRLGVQVTELVLQISLVGVTAALAVDVAEKVRSLNRGDLWDA